MREGGGVRQGKIGPVRCADRIYSLESWHLALRGLVLPIGGASFDCSERAFPLCNMLTWSWETKVVPSSLLLLL